MQNYTLFSDVDQIIVDRMANQSPSSEKRIRAVNLELDFLQSQYNLFDAVRQVEITVKTDGTTAYDLSTLTTDNDVKSVNDFILVDTSNGLSTPFTYIDNPEFIRKVEGGAWGNYYTVYTQDTVQYLKLLTIDPSTTAVDVLMVYTTTHKALDDDNDFIPKVTSGAGIKILLQENFKELIALGAILRLFYPAIGEDSVEIKRDFERDYNTQKEILGLMVAKTPQRVERKIKLRPQL